MASSEGVIPEKQYGAGEVLLLGQGRVDAGGSRSIARCAKGDCIFASTVKSCMAAGADAYAEQRRSAGVAAD